MMRPTVIVAAKPIEELLNRVLNALPVSVDGIILRGVMSEVANRILESQRASIVIDRMRALWTLADTSAEPTWTSCGWPATGEAAGRCRLCGDSSTSCRRPWLRT